jgi:hypothetical protein
MNHINLLKIKKSKGTWGIMQWWQSLIKIKHEHGKSHGDPPCHNNTKYYLPINPLQIARTWDMALCWPDRKER